MATNWDLARRRGSVSTGVWEVWKFIARQTEIGSPALSTAINHDISRLEVAVQHAFLMCRCQTSAELLGDLNALGLGQPTDLLLSRQLSRAMSYQA